MALTPFALPIYTDGGTYSGLRPPPYTPGGVNPKAYEQADALHATMNAFKPQPYMPWFAQQAPTANWGKTFNTAGWMPPWVMTPGTVGTAGTNLGLGGMFGYQGNYGASPGPGVGASTTWGGVPNVPTNTYTPNPLNIGTTPGTQNTGSSSGSFGSPTPTDDFTGVTNPIPNRTPTNYSGSTDFIKNFRFDSGSMTGDSLKDLARTTFNKIADQFGYNEAWTWALKNGWGDLSSGDVGLQKLASNAGIAGDDISRIVNTYGGNARYFGNDYYQSTPGRGIVKDQSVYDQFQQLIKPYVQAKLASYGY